MRLSLDCTLGSHSYSIFGKEIPGIGITEPKGMLFNACSKID
jgi:hypothetical protein